MKLYSSVRPARAYDTHDRWGVSVVHLAPENRGKIVIIDPQTPTAFLQRPVAFSALFGIRFVVCAPNRGLLLRTLQTTPFEVFGLVFKPGPKM